MRKKQIADMMLRPDNRRALGGGTVVDPRCRPLGVPIAATMMGRIAMKRVGRKCNGAK